MAKKILVVDDEPDLMDVATVRLKNLGYDVIPAVDAEAALELLKKTTPDLILLDLLLPKMQGDQLCRMLKSDERYKKIPIILFTASAMRTSLPENVADMGANDCILKPFEAKDLVDKVKKYIG